MIIRHIYLLLLAFISAQLLSCSEDNLQRAPVEQASDTDEADDTNQDDNSDNDAHPSDSSLASNDDNAPTSNTDESAEEEDGDGTESADGDASEDQESHDNDSEDTEETDAAESEENHVDESHDNEEDSESNVEETDGNDEETNEPVKNSCGPIGVDMLVVVDNSASMDEEQTILSSGFFTLINALTNPTSDWTSASTTDLRVAIVSTDMGLQYGEDGLLDESIESEAGCSKTSRGDDGLFLESSAATIEVRSGEIACDEGGSQCPSGSWTCEAGICIAPDEMHPIECPDSPTSTTEYSENMAANVACRAHVGTEGCGIEQQLQAAVKGLTREEQVSFIREDRMLAILVVSDEEDCSIKDNGLFHSTPWTEGHIATACTIPQEQEDAYLFPVEYFYEKMVALKNGDLDKIVFAAIVGVPMEDTTCQGSGSEIKNRGCLEREDMQYKEEAFPTSVPSVEYYEFVPACRRIDNNGEIVTTAVPGRRFVTLAQQFGDMGFVSSICNDDWSAAMREIATMVVGCVVVK